MSQRPPHQYRDLSPEEQESLFSNFLVNSWSYSKVSTFARNQIAFEMQYIYGIYGRSGASSIAGKAYHKALEVYFTHMKDGVHIPLPELDAIAFQHLEEVSANQWKLGKTTPTMEKAMEVALKTSNKSLRNFYSERGAYEDDIAEVLAVELKFTVWLTVNGVDIPLPCTVVIDLVVRTKKGKIAIVDHKSKGQYTDDKADDMVIGPQAITYALAYEEFTGQRVDEVWFMENKYSENKDGGVQIRAIKKELDANRRALYEQLLYGNLRQMIAAVKDPDHIYTVNTSDNLVDMAEVTDFYYRTLMCEVEDFNVEESKKDLVAKRIKKIKDSNIQTIPLSVIKAFKEKAASFIQYDYSVLNMSQQEKIVHVLRNFSIQSEVAHSFEGYSSNTFLLRIGAGTRIDSVKKFRLDIANALDVENVRISNQLVVYEGKSYLGIELKKQRAKDNYLLWTSSDRQGMKIPIGKDNYGRIIYHDLENQATPHMLVCGGTGSGKSEFLKSTISYLSDAGVEDFLILDPKQDFKYLKNAPGFVVLHDIGEIEQALKMLVDTMNERVEKGEFKYMSVIFDEFTDAVDTARSGKELNIYETYTEITPRGMKTKRELVGQEKSLEENFKIVLQKGRSVGIRMIAAAQRADSKVMSGNTKVNLTTQLCFRVQKGIDSKVVLDEEGAELLAGAGDALFRSPDYPDLVRLQAYYKPTKQHA